MGGVALQCVGDEGAKEHNGVGGGLNLAEHGDGLAAIMFGGADNVEGVEATMGFGESEFLDCDLVLEVLVGGGAFVEFGFE